MNKKGDVDAIRIVIFAIIIFMIGYALYYGFYSPKQKIINEETGKLIPKVDSDLSDFLNTKSFTTKEREKCAELSNSIADCIGLEKKEKTGCFWGKTNAGKGCYPCVNSKYLGGKSCSDYELIGLDDSEKKIVCEWNSCKFKETKNSITYNKCGFTTTKKCIFQIDSVLLSDIRNLKTNIEINLFVNGKEIVVSKPNENKWDVIVKDPYSYKISENLDQIKDHLNQQGINVIG